MPTLCKAGEAISKGDAVCVIGFDNNRPIVKRATRDNLATSKTVFGVAEDYAIGGSVRVLVAGEVAENNITQLGALLGGSRLVLTNTDVQIPNPNYDPTDPNSSKVKDIPEEQQCRLKRIDRPPLSPEGFVVGTCDEAGNLIIQPRHSSYETGFSKVHNVRAYGAVPDWDSTTNTGTDNLDAFNKAILAATNDFLNSLDTNVKTPVKILAEGWFYLSDTLHIPRGIILEGVGHGDPTHSPGTMLVFDTNVTGIAIHSIYDGDVIPQIVPDTLKPLAGVVGDLTQICNLTVHCYVKRGEPLNPETGATAGPNNHTGHGIHASSTCAIRDVTVINFAENGIYIASDGTPKDNPRIPGNAAGTHIVNTTSNQNGAHGFHFLGRNSNVSLIEMCSANLNWGNGFRDEGGIGNTYVACYCQGNLGERDTGHSKENDPLGYSKDGRNHDFYVANDAVNQSIFFGCYSEASVDHIYAPAGAIGGGLSEAGSFPPSPPVPDNDPNINDYFKRSNGFSLSSGGIAGIGPLITEYKHDLDGPRVEIGDCTEGKRAITLVTRKAGVPKDYLILLYLPIGRDPFHDWWDLQSSSGYRSVMRFPTVQSDARHPAPWMPNGLFIGRDDIPLVPEIAGREGLKNTIHMTAACLTSNLSPPSTQGDSGNSPQTYERGDIIWNCEAFPGGAIGQVCINRGTQTTANPATFATFGTVDSPSKSYAVDHTLDLSDRYVTVITDSKTMTFPSSPLDGQTHSIKCKAGVATTTVNTSDGLTIDGQPSVMLNSGENATFRYSDATGVKEWERR